MDTFDIVLGRYLKSNEERRMNTAVTPKEIQSIIRAVACYGLETTRQGVFQTTRPEKRGNGENTPKDRRHKISTGI